MQILQTSIIFFILQGSCTADLTKIQPIPKQAITKPDTVKVLVVKPDAVIKKDTVVYNDSIDAITTGHYRGLLKVIDQYYKRLKISAPGLTYRHIPLALFPYFCYKNELLPKDKPVIYFDAFKYNLMQIKYTQFGGELVAMATVSYIKRKDRKPPKEIIYRLNFYEYSAVTNEWRKSEYTTSITFILSKPGIYVNK